MQMQLSFLNTSPTISQVKATSGSDCGIQRRSTSGSGQTDLEQISCHGRKNSLIISITMSSVSRS
ncbi:hypothetical protein L345_12231 [Ophiophagus hannah]|uniref:Uncharacterized protein n=1 Tax=Ophiophagus hannah TaxID=8665 RepID=V8NJ92_OPHHA|nr:hypothetical protein L345_12231 [Ophiophagus hannah]